MIRLTCVGNSYNAIATNDGVEDKTIERIVITCDPSEPDFTAEVVRLDEERSTQRGLIRNLTKYRVVEIDITLQEID